MDHAKRGAEALDEKRFPDAVKEYTAAIKQAPSSPDYHIKRSTAYQRSSPPDFKSALADADKAVVLARARGKRELIHQAQLRRAIALFGMERYADAKFVIDIVKSADQKDKSAEMWKSKIETKLSALGSDHAGSKVTVTEIPNVDASAPDSSAEEPSLPAAAPQGEDLKDAPPSTAPVQTPINKIRHDWYQNQENVIFTLLAKGVPKGQAVIDIQERSLSISFPVVSGSTYDLSLEPLYAPVDVSQSKFSVLSTKVEVTLRKAQPGQKWHSLESSEPVQPTTASTSVVKQPPAPPTSGPAYPTSSRSGTKNWDKLADELTTKKAKENGSSGAGKGKDDDEWDYDREDGDDVNNFFKKLYGGADPDTRRAMMKSFTESNGTALSTNWGDVSKGRVPTEPPEGVVAKPWK